MLAETAAAARDWLDQDPDPTTHAELAALLAAAESGDAEAESAITERFSGRLAFGTAGLRGEIGAGPQRMNRVLVGQAAAGLARFLRERESAPSIVIGYDGRTNSDVFARDTAEIMAAAGVQATLLPRLLPTPVLAYAVRHLGASAGVMVTASHNPPRDNGYKVYLGGPDEGSQIVAPDDAAIAAHIDDVARTEKVTELPRRTDYALAPESVIEDYRRDTARALEERLDRAPVRAPLRVVYTAMHGVGWETFEKIAVAAGFTDLHAVPSQREPDAAFPTVAFPNPEEVGALDASIAVATEIDADLIVANDPDADRVSLAIPDAETETGWRQLTGNEVGWLLGWRAAERAQAEGRTDAQLACTIVSSPALAAIAADYGLGFTETLTGFKWVSRVPGLVFGYEEALGYLVNPETVRDKDGISAALVLLDLVAQAKARGRSVEDLLTAFRERFGAFGSRQLAIRVADLGVIGRIMSELRTRPPESLGGRVVDGIDDLAAGTATLPPSDALRFRLDGGSRVMARPSGTEPKLKFYVDTRTATPAEGAELLTAIISDLQRIADSVE